MEYQYNKLNYALSEITHKYGDQYHILSDPYLMTFLARLCAKNTIQPEINRLINIIYTNLIKVVLNVEFPCKYQEIETRMIQYNPEAVLKAPLIDAYCKTIVVCMARAGILPSHIVYDTLNSILEPAYIRQDHIAINRKIDDSGKVIGCHVAGCKIGGDMQDAFLLIPDPMGATGESIKEIINIYKNSVEGLPRKIIAIHLIITPEYIRNLKAHFPEVVVYAVRLDRGLSAEAILETIPGSYPEQERGLNENDYIVPGGGGFGEILNNSFV